MIHRLGYTCLVSGLYSEVVSARSVILPGVGSFDSGMLNLRRLGLDEAIHEISKKGTPLLGICLGMQMLGQYSEEGKLGGLGLVSMSTVRFNSSDDLAFKVPHVGWSNVYSVKNHPIIKGLLRPSRFYFVHSYHVVCQNIDNVLLNTYYGYDFCSAVECNNVFGVQFHPEKSHTYGMRLLDSFLSISNDGQIV